MLYMVNWKPYCTRCITLGLGNPYTVNFLDQSRLYSHTKTYTDTIDRHINHTTERKKQNYTDTKRYSHTLISNIRTLHILHTHTCKHMHIHTQTDGQTGRHTHLQGQVKFRKFSISKGSVTIQFGIYRITSNGLCVTLDGLRIVPYKETHIHTISVRHSLTTIW